MIIWSGWGFLAIFVFVGSVLLTELGVEAAMKDENYYQANGWPKLLAFVVAALIVWPLGRALNARRRTEEDDRRGTPDEPAAHTLFFIPLEYWAPLFLIAGVVFLLAK